MFATAVSVAEKSLFYTKTPAMMILLLVLMQLLLHGVLGDISNICPLRQDEGKQCSREECLQMADDMLEKMDTTTSPCQNFYQYACGGWLDRQILTPNRKKVTASVNNLPWALIRDYLAEAPRTTDILAVQKAKAFYASCVNYEAGQFSESARNVIKEKEGLFQTNQNWSLASAKFNLEWAMIDAIKLGVHFLFELRADPNSFKKEHRRSNLYVGKPVLGMPYDRYKFMNGATNKHAYMERLRPEFEVFRRTKYTDVYAAIVRYTELQMQLAEMYNNLTNKGTTVKMTLGQMDAEFGWFMNWTRFVSNLASSPEVGITDITPQEIVIVSDPEYLKHIFRHFTLVNARMQSVYMYLRVFESLQYAILEDDKMWDFYTDYGETQRSLNQHRELGCVKLTSQMFELVVHRFLYKTLKKDTLRTVQGIKRKMELRFAGIVNELDWLSTITKDTIVDKVLSIKTVLLYHANAMDDSLLESSYSNIAVDGNFIRNVARARLAAFVRDIKNIRTTREKDPPSFPYQFVAEYSQQLNTLHINPTVLRDPFHNDGYESLNFAGAGNVLARQLMSGFDTKGIRYNKDGVQGNWLTDSEVQAFNARVQCLVEQYNNYNYSSAYMHVNGTLTLDSNIADVTGLKLAYQAYSTYHPIKYDLLLLPGVPLTNEQMFFLKFAQMQCTAESSLTAISTMSERQSPDEFRVNGPLRNFQEFATAFDCPADSYMNPPNKCVVW